MLLTANETMKGKILIIEDESAIREMLGYALMKDGYSFLEAADVEEARPILQHDKPDLILMDWMLPGMSGVDYARRVRNTPETRDIPIIMLTARGEEADKVRGLDTGADDYITKPFSTKELLARIRALLRRTATGDDDQKAVINIDGLAGPDLHRDAVQHAHRAIARVDVPDRETIRQGKPSPRRHCRRFP